MANELASRMGVQPQNFLSYPYQLNYAPPLSQVAPVIPTEDKGFMGKMAERLFGADPVRAPFSQAYPSPQDVYYAQAYDQTYGTPMAGFTVPGAKVTQMPWKSVRRQYDDEIIQQALSAAPTEMSPEVRDEYLQNYIAAQKHPVSAIGYDPRALARTQKDSEAMVSLGGLTDPKTGQMWYHNKYPSAAVHESFHRGIQKLKDEGMLPESVAKSLMPNETMTRLLMLKNFGDIEVQPGADDGNEEIEKAKWWLKNYPDETNKLVSALEDAAQKYIAKKTPRGPR